MKPIKVSVSFHKQPPDIDGNQRDHEARYGGFNRQYGILEHVPADGGWLFRCHNLEFPRVNTDPEYFTHFSIAVCQAEAGLGGSIINAGPLDKPIHAQVGTIPKLTAIVGVHASRIEEMRADGRIHDVKPDPLRGTNLDAEPG